MKKIKAVLCDYDGTLADNKDQIPSATKYYISKLQEKNILFSLATGRAYYGQIEKIVRELQIQGIHIVHGGAAIFDTEKNKYYLNEFISIDSLLKICQYLKSKKVIFGLEAETFMYLHPYTHKSVYLRNIETKDFNDFDQNDRIYKILIFASGNFFDEKTIIKHLKNIQKLCFDIEVIRFKFNDEKGERYGADITSEKATKHLATLEYCKVLGIGRDELVAIGDSYNDYPLFTAAGYKIAMGNSPKELKEIADFIVPSVDESGIEVALKHILNMVK